MMRGMRIRGGARPQDVGQTIRRLMSYVARYRLRLVLVVLCIILSAVASVLSSTFIGILIDDYIAPPSSSTPTPSSACCPTAIRPSSPATEAA